MNFHYVKKRTLFAIFFSLFFFSGLNLFAQTTQYIGSANGDWFTAANWNNGLPAAGNDANISGGASVNISQPLIVNFGISNFGTINNSAALEIAKNLVSGGVLNNTSTGTITIDASIQLIASGGFTNAGIITNKGNVNINTAAFTNSVGATINNQGTWQQLAPLSNNGTVNEIAGLFTSPQLFTNNAVVNISAGANWTVDFGGSYINAVGSSLSNAGNFTNLANFTNSTTVTNTGVFTNNSIQNCNGIFNNESGGTILNASTFNIAGKLNNKSGATVQNANFICVLANGSVSNLAGATFNNNNKITVKTSGTFTNDVNSILNLGTGSVLIDSGAVQNLAGAKMIGSGSINNAAAFDNFGTIQADNGSTITNSGTLNNHGNIFTISIVNNSGNITNDSLIKINSGAVFSNTGIILNKLTGTFENNFEFYNKIGATFTNNGTFRNNIRTFNGGSYINNGYLLLAGDFFNQTGGKLINTEVIEINAGSIVNVGMITNSKIIYNDACSVISNNTGGSIANSGVIQTRGVVFQRSTFTGNAIVNLSGWIQTAATSDAKICVDTIRTGTTPQGEAKVYPQNVLLRVGLDSCNNFQYSVDGSTRRVYHCSDAGKVLDAKFVLLLRTGDSLTCNTKVSVFDGIAPIITACPDNISVSSINGKDAVATWTSPNATDNCGNATLVSDFKSGATFPVGSTTVTYSAIDLSGIKSSPCTFTVTATAINLCATDTQAPVIGNCPTNITVTAVQNATSAIATWTAPTATDNCSTATLVSNYLSGANFPVGSTTVTYSAIDLSGNKSLPCTFTVTVTANPCTTDTQAPIFSNCPTNINVTAAQNITSAIATWTAPTAIDNCGTPTVTTTDNPGGLFNIGTTTVTYTAKDSKNNASTCVFTVTVNSSSVCAPPKSAPNNWELIGSVNGKNYYRFTDNDYNGGYIDYWTAQNLCKSINGHLPIIKNQSENDFIKNGIGTKNCWIGMHRLDWGSPQWVCDDNSTPAYFNWNSGEPNNYGGYETTVQMYGNGSGKWNDCPGWCNNSVICEMPCIKCIPSITRTVSNSTDCSNKSLFGIWLNNQYYTLSDANFTENVDLTAKLTANCALGTVVINFTGRTTSGMPVFNTYCFTASSTADWYFYNNFMGTIGTYSVSSNPMHKFQVGKGANNHNKDVYGASGWITGAGVTGDLNILLSGNTATLNKITCQNKSSDEKAQSTKVFVVDAQPESNRVRIDFSTNRGFETDYFNVQKLNSTTGNFETLSIVNNTVSDNSLQAHSVYDNNPTEGDNFYQVEIALNDGTKTVSDVKKVNFNALRGLAIFPNPATDYIDVNLKDYVGKDVTIYIYNQLGVVQAIRQIQNVTSTTPEHIDINTLIGGQYLLRVESKGVKDAVKSVIKM